MSAISGYARHLFHDTIDSEFQSGTSQFGARGLVLRPFELRTVDAEFQFGTSQFGVRGPLPGPFETRMFQEEVPGMGLYRVLEEDPLSRLEKLTAWTVERY